MRVRARDYPHGTRARYVTSKCRCDECVQANREHARIRWAARKQGDFNGLIDAREAREHLRKLSRAGVGSRAVADTTSISMPTILGIKLGRQTHARARTVRKILAVTIDCRSDNQLVSGRSTWRYIDKLIEEGFTKRALARHLGLKSGIQFRRQRVTVKTRARVERLFEKLTT